MIGLNFLSHLTFFILITFFRDENSTNDKDLTQE
jgi:hypothetical protein